MNVILRPSYVTTVDFEKSESVHTLVDFNDAASFWTDIRSKLDELLSNYPELELDDQIPLECKGVSKNSSETVVMKSDSDDLSNDLTTIREWAYIPVLTVVGAYRHRQEPPKQPPTSSSDKTLNGIMDLKSRLDLLEISMNDCCKKQESYATPKFQVSELEKRLISAEKQIAELKKTVRNQTCVATSTSCSTKGTTTSRTTVTSNATTGIRLRHHQAICDGCNVMIAGNRYKCMECHDYDLCDACEKKSVESMNHRKEHQMLKIKSPERPKIAAKEIYAFGCPGMNGIPSQASKEWLKLMKKKGEFNSLKSMANKYQTLLKLAGSEEELFERVTNTGVVKTGVDKTEVDKTGAAILRSTTPDGVPPEKVEEKPTKEEEKPTKVEEPTEVESVGTLCDSEFKNLSKVLSKQAKTTTTDPRLSIDPYGRVLTVIFSKPQVSTPHITVSFNENMPIKQISAVEMTKADEKTFTVDLMQFITDWDYTLSTSDISNFTLEESEEFVMVDSDTDYDILSRTDSHTD